MTRLFSQDFRWVRIALFAVLFMTLPVIFEESFTAYSKYNYQTANVVNFFNPVALKVENICYGDVTQEWESERYVYGTETGWGAEIVRELERMNDDGSWSKVSDQKADIFIEKREGHPGGRTATLPVLDVGVYRWSVYYKKLFLPFNVVRTDAPALISNNFAVENCDNMK